MRHFLSYCSTTNNMKKGPQAYVAYIDALQKMFIYLVWLQAWWTMSSLIKILFWIHWLMWFGYSSNQQRFRFAHFWHSSRLNPLSILIFLFKLYYSCALIVSFFSFSFMNVFITITCFFKKNSYISFFIKDLKTKKSHLSKDISTGPRPSYVTSRCAHCLHHLCWDLT